MKTIKYEWHSANGRVGSDQSDTGEIEVEDDASDEDIEFSGSVKIGEPVLYLKDGRIVNLN